MTTIEKQLCREAQRFFERVKVSTFSLPCGKKFGWKSTTPFFEAFRSENVGLGENLAVVVGNDTTHGRLAVIDIDKTEYYEKILSYFPELVKTRTIETGNGYHLYLWLSVRQYDELSYKATHKIHVDGTHVGELKIKNGYVLGEGSKHPNGKIYTRKAGSAHNILYDPSLDLKQLLPTPAEKKDSVHLPTPTGKTAEDIIRSSKSNGLVYHRGQSCEERLAVNRACYLAGLSIGQAVGVHSSLRVNSFFGSDLRETRIFVANDYKRLAEKKLQPPKRTWKKVCQQYIQIPLDNSLTLIQSATGTGKTELICELISKLKETVCYVANTIALTRSFTHRSGIPNYQDVARREVVESMSTTFKSLPKFSVSNGRLVLDEVEAMFRSLIGRGSDLYTPKEKIKIILRLRQDAERGVKIVGMDNHIPKWCIDLLEQITKKKATLIKNTYKPKERQGIFYRQFTLFIDALEKALKRAEALDKTICLFCTERRTSEMMYRKYKDQYQCVLFNSETTKINPDILKLLEKNENRKGLRLLIYSPTLVRGADLNDPRIEETFVMSNGKTLPPQDVMQGVKRARQSKRIHFFLRPHVRSYYDKNTYQRTLANYRSVIDQSDDLINPDEKDILTELAEPLSRASVEIDNDFVAYPILMELENIKGVSDFAPRSRDPLEQAWWSEHRAFEEEQKKTNLKDGLLEALADPDNLKKRETFKDKKDLDCYKQIQDFKRSRGYENFLRMGNTIGSRRRLIKNIRIFVGGVYLDMPGNSADYNERNKALRAYLSTYLNIQIEAGDDLFTVIKTCNRKLAKIDRDLINRAFMENKKKIESAFPNFHFWKVERNYKDELNTMIESHSTFLQLCGLKLKRVGQTRKDGTIYEIDIDHLQRVIDYLNTPKVDWLDMQSYDPAGYRCKTMFYYDSLMNIILHQKKKERPLPKKVKESKSADP